MTDEKTMTLIYDEIGRPSKCARQYLFDHKWEWIPLSQIRDEDLTKQVIIIPEWLAVKKGLEAYELEN